MLKKTLIGLLEKALGLSRIDEIYADVLRRPDRATIWQKGKHEFDLLVSTTVADIRRIPATGPLIVVANHPTGAIEGVALPAILDGQRADTLVLAHSWFKRYPAIAERMIFVDPQAGESGKAANGRALVQAARHLRSGGALLLFPAGEVARFRPATGHIEESPWRSGVARLMRMTGATVLPIHVGARNGWLFHLLSSLQARLGALVLGRELLAKHGSSMTMRVGQPIAAERFDETRSLEEITAMLQRTVADLAPAGKAHPTRPMVENLSPDPRSG